MVQVLMVKSPDDVAWVAEKEYQSVEAFADR